MNNSGTFTVDGNTVLTDLLAAENTGALYVRHNRSGNVRIANSGGSLIIYNNMTVDTLEATGNTGGTSISENRIRQTLLCEDNDPQPTGSGNVAGRFQGQCRQ